MTASLKHQPDRIFAPLFFARARNSLTSLVFPTPASPKIKTVVPFPLKAESKCCRSCSISEFLPTKAGSAGNPGFNLFAFQELNSPEMDFNVLARAISGSNARMKHFNSI